jgi:undecaprenyl-diphosphatase
MIKRTLSAIKAHQPHKSNPLSFYFFEIAIGVILCIFAILLFTEIAENVFGQETQGLDIAVSRFIYSFRSPLLTNVMLFFSFMGAEFTLIAASAGAIFLGFKHRKREAVMFLSLFGMGVVLNLLLKTIFQRPRPDLAPLVHLHSYSFPSTHAMNAFIFYSIFSFFVWHLTHNKRKTIIAIAVSSVLIILIGFSRVYLGVHYPSDILGGYVAGFFVFMTAIILQQTLTLFL